MKGHIVVIGATGGIGEALCRILHAEDFGLTIGARDEARLSSLAAELGAHRQSLDATDSGAVDAFFQSALQRNGRIDGAVNLAGSILLKAAHQTSDDEWHKVLSINLTTAFCTVRAAARAMMNNAEPSGGSVVLVSSVAARFGLANHEAIAAAKAGVQGLTLSAAATYARYNLRFNCVAPGLVRTPLTKNLTSSEAVLKASTAMHPLGRIGEPADVAHAIAMLLRPENSWITGQILGIDGGMGSLRPR
jgi:3-oxoacyl-[acyl-carrier protein] reductase